MESRFRTRIRQDSFRTQGAARGAHAELRAAYV